MLKIIGNVVSESQRSGGESYGILPSKKTPRWLVPLRKNNLVASFAIYQPSLMRAKLLKYLMIIAVKSGFSKLVIRDKIYIRKNDEKIKKMFNRDDLYYSIFTGTGGPHQKITIQVMDRKGAILGYIKASGNKKVDKLLQNEVEILRYLSRFKIKSGLFPKLIYHGELTGTNVLVLDTLKSVHSTFSSKLSNRHINFLSEIFLKTANVLKYTESDFFRNLRQRLRDLEAKRLLIDTLGNTYKRAADYIEKEIGDMVIPFGLCHRDFTPWNTFFHEGRLYAFDWEYARREYPPMLDMFHFIVQDGILVKHLKPEGLLKRVLKHKELLRRYSGLIGIKESLIIPLLTCYLLDISLFYIEREKGRIAGDIKHMLDTWKRMMELIMSGMD